MFTKNHWDLPLSVWTLWHVYYILIELSFQKKNIHKPTTNALKAGNIYIYISHNFCTNHNSYIKTAHLLIERQISTTVIHAAAQSCDELWVICTEHKVCHRWEWWTQEMSGDWGLKDELSFAN